MADLLSYPGDFLEPDYEEIESPWETRDITELTAQQTHDWGRIEPLVNPWIAEGRIVPVIGTGVRFMLPDGYVIKPQHLRFFLEGWTPESLQAVDFALRRIGTFTGRPANIGCTRCQRRSKTRPLGGATVD